MLPPKKAVRAFLLRFILILAVYSIPWRPIGTAYATLAAGFGNLVVEGAFSSKARLHFGPVGAADPDDARAAYNVELRAESVATRTVVSLPIDLRTLTYIPTAVFIALSVAAPIWERSKGVKVLLFGLAALHLFLVFSIAAPLVLFFANPAPMHLVELGPITHWVLDVLYRALVAPPGMAFVVPGAVWLLMLWVTR